MSKKQRKEKKQNAAPLTPNKAFKRVLPVLIVILLFVAIGITLAVITGARGKNATVSNAKENYLQYGNFTVTKGELYETLKKDYGLSQAIKLIDEHIFAEEINKVSLDSAEYLQWLKEQYIDEEADEEDIKKTWEETLDASVVNGTITAEEKEQSLDYNDMTNPAWKAYAKLYRLDFAKRQWALAKLFEEYRASNELAADAPLISQDEIKKYYEKNYGKGGVAIAIPFTSEAAAKAMMEKYHINTSVLSKYKDGWVKDSFDSTKQEKPLPTDYFTENEVMETFINMYNEVLAYYNNGAGIITNADNYTANFSATKTVNNMKKVLAAKMTAYTTVKQDLELPTSILVAGLDKVATIKWEKDVKNSDNNTVKEEVVDGKLTVEVPESDSTSIKLTATISLEGAASSKVEFTVNVKADAEEITAPFETQLSVAPAHDWVFTLDNEMGNGHSQFVWEFGDTSTLGKQVLTTLKLDTYPGAFTISPLEVKNTNNPSYFYLVIKVGETQPKTLEELTEEITEKLTEEIYADSNKLEKFYFEARAAKNIVFYDNYLEALYQYSYDACYSSLKITQYPEFKTTNKTNKSVVAKIDGLEVTADMLFNELEDSYAPIALTSILNRYFILKDNTLYNPWTNTKDKKFVSNAVKADVNSAKYYFSLDYFANYMGYYYFGISTPNFSSKYGWSNFIKDYYGADSDEELLLLSNSIGGSGRVYGEALRKYRDTVISYDELKKVMDKRNNSESNYKVDVLNVIIYVDYNYDGTADTKISTSNAETVDEENWTAEQIGLVQELSKIIMTKNTEASEDEDLFKRLEAVVKVYNEAPSFVVAGEEDKLASQFAKFKAAGLQIMVQKSTFDHCDSLVQEFHDGMKALWDIANESEAGLTETKNMYYNQIDAETYAFSSPYGYHAVVVTNFYETVAAPTEKEIGIYRAMSIVEDARSTVKTVNDSLANENVKANKSLAESYKAQLYLAERAIEEGLEVVRQLVDDPATVTADYVMSEELKGKIHKWIEASSDSAISTKYGSTNPDIEEYTSNLVITTLLNEILAEYKANKFTFGSTSDMNFDGAKFERYMQSLLDEYKTEEE